MTRRRLSTLTGFVACTAMLALLAGCNAAAETPTAEPASVSPTADPTPAPTATSSPTAAAVTLPTDCDEVGSGPTRAAAVGDLTLQSDGEGFVRPAPAGATLALGCDWILDEVAGVLLLISTAPAADVEAALPGLSAEGYTCQVSDDFGAEFCVSPGAGTDTEEMIVAREGVWVYLSTVDRNGRALLSEIVSGIFA